MMLSSHHAVCEALLTLGHHTPSAEVRRHLAERGVDVEEAFIDKVRQETLGGGRPAP
jgi:hypothetical protein